MEFELELATERETADIIEAYLGLLFIPFVSIENFQAGIAVTSEMMQPEIGVILSWQW